MKLILILLLNLFIINDVVGKTTEVVTAAGTYQYKENGQLTGPATQIVRQLFNESAVDYQIKFYPWVRAFKQVSTKPNTFIYSIIRNTKREQKFHWIGHLDSSPFYLYKFADRSDIKIESFSQLNAYKIGVIRSDLIHTYLQEKNFLNISVAANPNQHFKKFEQGRFDLMAFQAASLPLICKVAKIDCAKLVPAYQLDEIAQDIYVAANLNTPLPLVNKLRNQFKKMEARGDVSKIINTWQY